MDLSTEHQLSLALLEKLEPLVLTVQSQLRDLAQGQVILQSNIAQLSSELSITEAELDKVHDTFARLPHYVAKVTAIKNTIASVTVISRKLQRRADQVVIGREKQAARQLASRAKEQAYDQAVAAAVVRTTPSGSSQEQDSLTQTHDRPGTPTRAPIPVSPSPLTATSMRAATAAVSVLESATAAAVSMASRAAASSASQSPQSSSPIPGLRLPFPLPAKPAFPVVSTMRPSSTSGSPTTLPSTRAPQSSGRDSDRNTTGSPVSGNSVDIHDRIQGEDGREDRFPQVSSLQQEDASSAAVGLSTEVEVVRLRRKKKKDTSKSSGSSTASVSTTASAKKTIGTKTKTSKSALGILQAEHVEAPPE
ncbi:hypothetical protein BGZ99_005231 [Dissophora globulifera]|uniref:Uncharacterized protein n=1 Tax=Dissophora globulifera TaxID=979702 RepID=A0A9P6UTN5_9FUNG|nr:hypothetical protein BGZ99_005231 [Dissophora globulifera]